MARITARTVEPLKVRLDLDMSAFNDGIAEAKKKIDGLVKKYQKALELQHKIKEGEDDADVQNQAK